MAKYAARYSPHPSSHGQASSVNSNPRFSALLLAILSGAFLGCAFPPVDIKWLVWIGLIPLLVAINRTKRLRSVALLGYIAGFVFFLITLHPLVSVYTWAGWAAETPQQFTLRMSKQWYFMQGIWIAFSLWCAIFWAIWAVALKRLASDFGLRALFSAASLWIIFPEWARSQTTFGFAWAFLGNATADIPSIRQLAALGGVWSLSALVVVVNVGCAGLLMPGVLAKKWKPLAVAFSIAVLVWLGGTRYINNKTSGSAPITAAAFQYYKAQYAPSDFTDTGLDRKYIEFAPEAFKRGVHLLVLPESIVLGDIVLDNSVSKLKPKEFQRPRALWDAQMRKLLSGTSALIVLGADTVERGEDHNTLVAWTAKGVAGWYHKRRLVPFSEYRPWGWGDWAIRGQSQYVPGVNSQLILVPGIVIGGFICQEVLIPWVTRESARDGATLLISGGNDGVFANPAVAKVHADVAQLRAVETERYIVRAMKTGISAIIDPHGRELERSVSSEPTLLIGDIIPQNVISPYVRFGDWILWLAAAFVLIHFLMYVKPRRRKS